MKIEDRKLIFNFLCDKKKVPLPCELNGVEKSILIENRPYFLLYLFSDGSKVSWDIYQIMSTEKRK
jgi:hypothetical protein